MEPGTFGEDHEEFMDWVNAGGANLSRALFDEWIHQHAYLVFAENDSPIVSKTQVKKEFLGWLSASKRAPFKDRKYIVRSIHFQLKGINFSRPTDG